MAAVPVNDILPSSALIISDTFSNLPSQNFNTTMNTDPTRKTADDIGDSARRHTKEEWSLFLAVRDVHTGMDKATHKLLKIIAKKARDGESVFNQEHALVSIIRLHILMLARSHLNIAFVHLLDEGSLTVNANTVTKTLQDSIPPEELEKRCLSEYDVLFDFCQKDNHLSDSLDFDELIDCFNNSTLLNGAISAAGFLAKDPKKVHFRGNGKATAQTEEQRSVQASTKGIEKSSSKIASIANQIALAIATITDRLSTATSRDILCYSTIPRSIEDILPAAMGLFKTYLSEPSFFDDIHNIINSKIYRDICKNIGNVFLRHLQQGYEPSHIESQELVNYLTTLRLPSPKKLKRHTEIINISEASFSYSLNTPMLNRERSFDSSDTIARIYPARKKSLTRFQKTKLHLAWCHYAPLQGVLDAYTAHATFKAMASLNEDFYPQYLRWSVALRIPTATIGAYFAHTSLMSILQNKPLPRSNRAWYAMMGTSLSVVSWMDFFINYFHPLNAQGKREGSSDEEFYLNILLPSLALSLPQLIWMYSSAISKERCFVRNDACNVNLWRVLLTVLGGAVTGGRIIQLLQRAVFDAERRYSNKERAFWGTEIGSMVVAALATLVQQLSPSYSDVNLFLMSLFSLSALLIARIKAQTSHNSAEYHSELLVPTAIEAVFYPMLCLLLTAKYFAPSRDSFISMYTPPSLEVAQLVVYPREGNINEDANGYVATAVNPMDDDDHSDLHPTLATRMSKIHQHLEDQDEKDPENEGVMMPAPSSIISFDYLTRPVKPTESLAKNIWNRLKNCFS